MLLVCNAGEPQVRSANLVATRLLSYLVDARSVCRGWTAGGQIALVERGEDVGSRVVDGVDHCASTRDRRRSATPPCSADSPGRSARDHQSPLFEVVDGDVAAPVHRWSPPRRPVCTVIGARLSRWRIRILLNGRPDRSTTTRFQPSRWSHLPARRDPATPRRRARYRTWASFTRTVDPAISGASRCAERMTARRRRDTRPEPQDHQTERDTDEPQRPRGRREVGPGMRQRRTCDRTTQCHTDTHADLAAGRRHRRSGTGPIERHSARPRRL